MKRTVTIGIAIIAIIVLLVVGFYTGRTTTGMIQAINTNARNIQVLATQGQQLQNQLKGLQQTPATK